MCEHLAHAHLGQHSAHVLRGVLTLPVQGMLIEAEKREMGGDVASLDIAPVPEGRQRARFLAGVCTPSQQNFSAELLCSGAAVWVSAHLFCARAQVRLARMLPLNDLYKTWTQAVCPGRGKKCEVGPACVQLKWCVRVSGPQIPAASLQSRLLSLGLSACFLPCSAKSDNPPIISPLLLRCSRPAWQHRVPAEPGLQSPLPLLL